MVLRQELVKRIAVWGRVYPGVLDQDSKNYRYTINRLKALDLRGIPIWYEHIKGDEIGSVIENWVDFDGWLCVKAMIHGPERIGPDRHEKIREMLKTRKLKDFSIHWVGKFGDVDSGIIDDDSKHIIEISLTEEGKYKGSHLLSVALSGKEKSDNVESKQAFGGGILGVTEEQIKQQQKPTLTMANPKFSLPSTKQEIEDWISKHESKLSTEEIASAETLEQKRALVYNKIIEEKAHAQLEQMKSQLTPSEELERLRMENSELQKQVGDAKEFMDRAKKGYAEEQRRLAQGFTEKIGQNVWGDKYSEMAEALFKIAENTDAKPVWDQIRAFGQFGADNYDKVQHLERVIKKYKQDNADQAVKLQEYMDRDNQMSQEQQLQEQVGEESSRHKGGVKAASEKASMRSSPYGGNSKVVNTTTTEFSFSDDFWKEIAAPFEKNAKAMVLPISVFEKQQ